MSEGKRKLRLGVLVSGRGSNLEAILEAAERGEIDASVVVVISDRRDAPALGRAERRGIEAVWLDPKAYPTRQAYDERVVEVLRERRVDLVCLAGYMRIVTRALLEAFPWRVMNIHPALLPSFPGREAQLQAIQHGVKVAGCTVHFVDEGADTGPIIIQKAVPVEEDDTAETLADRILTEEHRIYPQAIQLFAEGRLRIVGAGKTPAADETAAASGAIAGRETPAAARGPRVEVLPPRTEEAVHGTRRRRRALVSVHDKTGLPEFARGLVEAGFELVSSGGTARAIRAAGLPVTPVEDVTGFPEMLDGRVKTLHPAVHGGILARRDLAGHLEAIERHGIRPIDLVAVNLYPFQETVNRQAAAGDQPGAGAAFAEAVENIDIGGPTLIRSAAKNHEAVVVVTDPSQYELVLGHLAEGGDVPVSVRRELALAAFRHTSFYDAVIAEYLEGACRRPASPGLSGRQAPPGLSGRQPASGGQAFLPDRLILAYEKVSDLRYGENPHQKAAYYRRPLKGTLEALGATLPAAVKLQGKELSYNNIADAEAALRAVEEFPEGPAAVAVKHMNPCGAAVAADILTAYRLAYDSDPVSIFGGIVALNREVDAELAAELLRIFLEVVIAPGFTPGALEALGRKPDLRLLAAPVGAGRGPDGAVEARTVLGGLLVQTADLIQVRPTAWKTVTARRPTEAELHDLFFAWRIVKHVKSNAIAVAKGRQLLGVGAGQMNRVDSTRLACGHAGDRARGAVLASDAFFPFPDSVEVAAAAGVTAIVQPGGSVKDADSVKVCDAAGMAMVVTGERHFRH